MTVELACLLLVNLVLVAAVVYLSVRTHTQDRRDLSQLLRALMARNPGEFARMERDSRPMVVSKDLEAEFDELRHHLAMVQSDDVPLVPEGL